MKFEPLVSADTGNVIHLFKDVFGKSEGEKEGGIIANLVTNLLLTEPKDLSAFIVKEAEIVVGCIIFSKITLAADVKVMILSPLAIATDYQNKGLGQRLVEYGIEEIIKQNVSFVITYGDPKFYSRVGFEPVSEKVIKPPYKLSYPHGWLALSLDDKGVFPINAAVQCVPALMNPMYW